MPNYDCSVMGRSFEFAAHGVTLGVTLRADLGISRFQAGPPFTLYDPSRPLEAQFCRTLGAALRSRLPELAVHMNQPYRGVSNGMGQQHRRDYDDSRLITLELEINQRLIGLANWTACRKPIAEAIAEAVAETRPT